ncbi:hypothetical protein [Bythopirellula goksoeyrii]|nr:hypothetical protein [Bythopirellula goksoeyrii]
MNLLLLRATRVLFCLPLLQVTLSVAPTSLWAQSVFYSFTSGPGGDGFDWPASPTGLLDGDYFYTPDGVEFDNYISNNLFFDDNYLVSGNSSDIDGDAMWGNPNSGTVDFYLSGLSVQSVAFNFAQSVGGAPFLTDDYIYIYIEDSEGRATDFVPSLNNSFTGLGGFDGYSDLVQFDTSFLIDDYDSVDGGPLVDIDYFYIELYSLDNTSEPAEFAIDNFSLNGGGGNGSDLLYPSVNGGQTNVTDSTLGSNSLRGTGTFGRGVEVTNDAASATTYTVELLPGGDLAPGTLPSAAPINPGETIFSSDIATIDRSLPSGTYESDLNIVNNGVPLDPDNVVTLSVDLYESESLSGNFSGVDVKAFEDVSLSNAEAPAGGFRAAVKVTGSQTTGPFEVDDFPVDQRVLDGETIQANVVFRRFGQLSGLREGTYTVSLEQAAFVVNQFVDFEVFLANKEPVPDKTWDLDYLLTNSNNDNANFTAGFSYANRLGVNRFEVAATLIDGTSSKNQGVSMQFMTDPDPASADIIGEPVDLVFGGGAGDLYVLQFTYDESLVPSGFAESQLQVLWYDTIAGEWDFAIDGNSSTSTSTFFAGSYSDYLAGPGGGVLDAGDLSAFGVDETNNHAWAVLDHASLFAVGVLTSTPMSADFDFDGDVDGNDFLVWQRNPSVGNLSDWQANYGQPLTAVSTVVPEPAVLILLLSAMVFLPSLRQAI